MFRIDLFTQNNTPGINEWSLRLAFGKYAIVVFVLRFSFARELREATVCTARLGWWLRLR